MVVFGGSEAGGPNRRVVVVVADVILELCAAANERTVVVFEADDDDDNGDARHSLGDECVCVCVRSFIARCHRVVYATVRCGCVRKLGGSGVGVGHSTESPYGRCGRANSSVDYGYDTPYNYTLETRTPQTTPVCLQNC